MKAFFPPFSCLSLALVPYAAADIHWSNSAGNTDGWSLATYTNESSAVIGNFSYQNKGVINVTEPGSDSGDPDYIYYYHEGLTGNEVGFLKYDLGTALSSFKDGEISLAYNDAYTSAVLPSCIMLEGKLEDNTRVLLACEIPSSGSQTTTIALTADNFKMVSSFYYTSSPWWGDPNDDPRTLTFSTGASLSEEAFAAFLATADSVFIRNFAYEGNSPIGGMGGGTYTYVTRLDITARSVIPEPASGALAAAGIALLAVRRRK